MGKNLKKKLSQQKRNELRVLTDAILVATRKESSDDFAIYEEISLLLSQIIKIEGDRSHFKTSQRTDEAVERFGNFCKDEGANFKKIQLKNCDNYGLGLIAREPLKKDEVFIEIPESLIFSFNKVKDRLPEVLSRCPLFESNSSIRLSLALIVEKLNPKSKWKPYLDVLPDKFRTVLYFTPNEMNELRGTSAFIPALNQVKFIASQYAFLCKYLMVANSPHPIMEELKECFTYDFYRYAVSICMTRQNLLPQDDGSREPVLIPLWDMANHVNGTINTQYNDESHQIESFCLSDFEVGQQVTMAYGNRTNEEFLIHNGFVYADNQNKELTIRLSLSKSDELFKERVMLFNLLGLLPSDNFKISPDKISSELIAFVRVFSMNKDQLAHWMKAENPKDLLKLDLPLDVAFQKKISQFLLMRIKIILKAFPSGTLEADQLLLQQENFSKTKRMLIEYRMLEKTILHEVLASLEEQMKLF